MTNKNDALKARLKAQKKQPLDPASEIIENALETPSTPSNSLFVNRETKSKKIQLTLYPKICNKLDEIAAVNRVSRNHLINLILSDFVNDKMELMDDAETRNIAKLYL